MKLPIDCPQTEPQSVADDIAKAVQTQIWKDCLLILFFALTASVVTYTVQ